MFNKNLLLKCGFWSLFIGITKAVSILHYDIGNRGPFSILEKSSIFSRLGRRSLCVFAIRTRKKSNKIKWELVSPKSHAEAVQNLSKYQS